MEDVAFPTQGDRRPLVGGRNNVAPLQRLPGPHLGLGFPGHGLDPGAVFAQVKCDRVARRYRWIALQEAADALIGLCRVLQGAHGNPPIHDQGRLHALEQALPIRLEALQHVLQGWGLNLVPVVDLAEQRAIAALLL